LKNNHSIQGFAMNRTLKNTLRHSVFGLLAASALWGCGSEDLPTDSRTGPSENGPLQPPPPEPPEPRAALNLISADAMQNNPAANLQSVDYRFGRIAVIDPQRNASYETDVHGYITYNANATAKMPVILLMHGRHQTCETDIGQLPILIADDDTCPNINGVLGPADSYRGYQYLVDHLASHGYAVISVDANDINDNDGSPNSGDAGGNARAQLIQAHLDAFRDIEETGSSTKPQTAGGSLAMLQGKLDMNRIGTMGHSRGGDGVAKYVSYNRQQARPHKVIATFGLAPTDYNMDVVDGMTFATLLPYCDGDVEDVQGAFFYDDSRYLNPNDATPKFQIVTMGSNHNYFNTLWTSDDWTITNPNGNDPFCGTNAATNQRDTPAEQRALGQFFMASFFRYFVGGEQAFASYWNGRAAVPDFACPSGTGPCEFRHHLSITPKATDRVLINSFGTANALSTNELGGAVTQQGLSTFELCDPDIEGVGCPSATTFSITPQAALAWSGQARLRNEFNAMDASDFDLVSIRVAVSTLNTDKTVDQNFTLVLEDATGKTFSFNALEFTSSLYNPPGNPEGGGSRKTLLNAIDFPISVVTGIDLGKLNAVEIRFDQSAAGALQVADLMLQRTAATR
jgi:dienelactone hydrolase